MPNHTLTQLGSFQVCRLLLPSLLDTWRKEGRKERSLLAIVVEVSSEPVSPPKRRKERVEEQGGKSSSKKAALVIMGLGPRVDFTVKVI